MAPPRRARAPYARPRRGSVERPINARLVRGTWLFVALPLLLAAFTIGRPQPLPAPTLPAAFDGPTAEQLARELARNYPDRAPGSAGSLGAAEWVSEQLTLYDLTAADGPLPRQHPGPRPCRAPEHRRVRAGRLAARNRDHRPPRQQRRGARRQRQRLGHGRADRARPSVRTGGRLRGADAPIPYPRLRLHRRRRVRRPRSSSVRRAFALSRRRAGRDQPRRDRRHQPTAVADRRRHGPLTGRCARSHCGGTRARAVRSRARAFVRHAPAARPRLSVHLRRARPVRRTRHPGGDAHHSSGRSVAGLRRRPAQYGAPGRARPRDPEPHRLARRRARAGPGNDELRVSRTHDSCAAGRSSSCS